ncbi:hypothetical protein ACFX12_036583 [Malus domestica]
MLGVYGDVVVVGIVGVDGVVDIIGVGGDIVGVGVGGRGMKGYLVDDEEAAKRQLPVPAIWQSKEFSIYSSVHVTGTASLQLHSHKHNQELPARHSVPQIGLQYTKYHLMMESWWELSGSGSVVLGLELWLGLLWLVMVGMSGSQTVWELLVEYLD